MGGEGGAFGERPDCSRRTTSALPHATGLFAVLSRQTYALGLSKLEWTRLN